MTIFAHGIPNCLSFLHCIYCLISFLHKFKVPICQIDRKDTLLNKTNKFLNGVNLVLQCIEEGKYLIIINKYSFFNNKNVLEARALVQRFGLLLVGSLPGFDNWHPVF